MKIQRFNNFLKEEKSFLQQNINEYKDPLVEWRAISIKEEK